MNGLLFGWSEVSITPDKKVSLCGQFAERISEYVEKPITATALAVSGADDQMVLVSCDLEGLSAVLRDTVRDKLKNNGCGLDPMKVVMSVTHTHCGPSYKGHGNSSARYGGGSVDFSQLIKRELPPGRKYVESAKVTDNPELNTPEELLEFLSDRIAQAALEAWRRRAPGSFINAFGRAAVGMCRRVRYTDGTAQMWGNTDTAVFSELEGGNDSGIELLYLFDEQKKLTGVAANLACPAQCVQHRLFVSPDFWGEVKKLLRERFGQDIFLLPLCAPAGDQCPVDLVRWVEPESDVHDPNISRSNPPKRKADPSMFDLSGMRRVGKRIAREIIDVYDEGLDGAVAEAPLMHEVLDVQLPLRRVTPTQIREARRAVREYMLAGDGDADYRDAAALLEELGILTRAELQERMEALDAEVHVIRLGSVAFASDPFELFLDYGNRIRARSPAEQTFLIQLANGSEGYLPTEKAEAGGHYSAFAASGLVGHQGGEQLVRVTLKTIRELFSQQRLFQPEGSPARP